MARTIIEPVWLTRTITEHPCAKHDLAGLQPGGEGSAKGRGEFKAKQASLMGLDARRHKFQRLIRILLFEPAELG